MKQNSGPLSRWRWAALTWTLAIAGIPLPTHLAQADPSIGALADAPLSFRIRGETPLLLRPEAAAWAARLPLSAEESLPPDLVFDPLALGRAADTAFRCANGGSGGAAHRSQGRSAGESQPSGRLIETGIAAWYKLRGKTASGERADPTSLTAAHRTLPLGSRVRVVNNLTGASVGVRINDRGPAHKRFAIDLSRAGARALGFVGVLPVSIYLLGDRRAKADASACDSDGRLR